MPGPFGKRGLEILELPDVVRLRPGLHHTVLEGTPAGLFPGRILPLCCGGDVWPLTAVVVAEAEPIVWRDVPAEGFERHHYRGRSKPEAAADLSLSDPGQTVTRLWFVVAGADLPPEERAG